MLSGAQTTTMATDVSPSSSPAPAPSGAYSAADAGALCVLVIGMAGSGKTSLVQRLNAALLAKGAAPYLVNLDPAVLHLPFGPNIDIRDTVNYKEVMRQYGPGEWSFTPKSMAAIRVWKIEIASVTGKQSRDKFLP